MENPPMVEKPLVIIDRIPYVAFHGTFGKGDRAQIGVEAKNRTKYIRPCIGHWWGVIAPHGVIGFSCCLHFLLELGWTQHQVLVIGVVGCRVTGMDR